MRTPLLCSSFAAFILFGLAPARSQEKTSWRLTGDLSEACTCSVPCSCNFGEGPSPHHFCWAVFSLDIQKGSYGDVNLDGLRMAGANGAKGGVWYIDARANDTQTEALKKIGAAIWANSLKANGITDPKKAPAEQRLLGFQRARIEQTVGEKRNYLKIVGAGGFTGDYIMGMDGKTPVVVENNASWNIQHGIKAKTRQLQYKDVYGNRFDFKQTNSNQGKFDWNDTTPVYFK